MLSHELRLPQKHSLASLPRMSGLLASLASKALASAADSTAVAAATSSACLPLVLAGLGLAVWDVVEDRKQGAQLGDIENDLRDALRKLRDVLADTGEVERRSLLAGVGQHLAADTIAALEGIPVEDLPFDDQRRPYLILHRFLARRFDTADEAERGTRALIHGLRHDVLRISQRLDAKADARFEEVCGKDALASASTAIERIEQRIADLHRKTDTLLAGSGRIEETLDAVKRTVDEFKKTLAGWFPAKATTTASGCMVDIACLYT